MSDTFQGAHDFVLNNPNFVTGLTINVIPDSDHGLEKLLKASMPDAFHDSGAQDPPRCHPGTRLAYINKISTWGSGTSQQHPERILWMEGPAGVGKSAIAQTCAQLLAEQDQLGAAFFFSRPNQRENPRCLFPSLSYQITVTSDAYAEILDRKVQRNPAVLEKSLAGQFDELLVKPLEELRGEKKGMRLRDYVIIIDGLDECAGAEAQEQIVNIIARSVQDTTTPFCWAFFSRPESHIISSFTSCCVHPLCLHLELPVSRKVDHEILCYLVAELKRIREKHHLPSSWPSGSDLGTLVDQSAGLFIYASTVICFVGDCNSLGPVDQLQLFFALLREAASSAGSDHPLSELDLFYTLIMRCIPSKVLPMIQKILLLHDVTPRLHYSVLYSDGQAVIFANCLGLSETQFRNTCAVLRLVLELDSDTIKFYHASFMDFLKDLRRSKEFCIYRDFLDVVRQELLERLNYVHAQSVGQLTFHLTWSDSDKVNGKLVYRFLVHIFFFLCRYPRPLSPLTASGLVRLQFRVILRFFLSENRYLDGGEEVDADKLIQNLLTILRDKIICRARNPAVYFHKPMLTKWAIPYILGQGNNRVVLWFGTKDARYIPAFSWYPSIL